MYPLEDHAARALSDAADTRHAAMKSALSRPTSVPAGFLDPIQTIAKARASLAADRARAGVVVPFEKRAAPAPRPAPPPSQPLRPAAKVARSTTRKLQEPLDTKQRAELADLFRTTLLKAFAR